MGFMIEVANCLLCQLSSRSNQRPRLWSTMKSQKIHLPSHNRAKTGRDSLEECLDLPKVILLLSLLRARTVQPHLRIQQTAPTASQITLETKFEHNMQPLLENRHLHRQKNIRMYSRKSHLRSSDGGRSRSRNRSLPCHFPLYHLFGSNPR